MAGLRFTATQKGHPCASLTGPVCRAGHRRGPAYALIGLIAAAAPAIAADDTTRQRFEYDRQQRLSRATLADGATTSLAYDSSNRLNELRFVSAPSTNAPGAEEIVRYRYDQVSRIAAIEGGAGRLTVAYDDGDLPVSISAPGVPTLSYSYDPSGDVASVVWSPAPVTYRRDLFGNLVDVDHRDLKISYEYSGNARQTVRHLPGGITTTYQYSALGELISIRHVAADGQPICTFGYQYDPIGRVTGADEAGRGWSIHKDYSYDAVGRLARYRDSSGDASSYEYDALGNRIAEAGRHGRIAFGYDGAGRLLSAGAATFSYDRAGRRIGRKDAFGETGYTYDPTGQLASVTRAGVSVRYVYDGDGQRLRRDAPDGDTIYLVDRLTAVPQIVTEYDGSSRLIREYTLARTRAVQRDAHGGTTYLLEDRLGSTRCVIDSTGGVLARYDYSPFGEPRLVEGTPQTDFLFAGEHWDAAAKLYYLRARYYDPGTGQFITPDPLGGVLARPQSFNAYAYTENDPVNRLDPLGLQSVWQDDLGESLEREHTARSDLWSNLAQGRYFGTLQGQTALEWYSQHYVRAGNWEERLLYGLGGVVSAVWTPDTWLATGLTLASGPLERPLAALQENLLRRFGNWLAENGWAKSTGGGGIHWPLLTQTFGNQTKDLLHFGIDDAGGHIGGRWISTDAKTGAITDIRTWHVRPRSIHYGPRVGGVDLPVPVTWLSVVATGGALYQLAHPHSQAEGHQGSGNQAGAVARSPDDDSTRKYVSHRNSLNACPDGRCDGGGPGGGSPEGGAGGPGGATGGANGGLGSLPTVGGVYLDRVAEVLGKIGTIRGAMYDEAAGRLVLLGDREVGLPPLKPAYLGATLEAAYYDQSGESPGITIDPDPKDPTGPTMIVRYFGDRTIAHSLAGLTMFESDRLMKGLSVGVDNISANRMSSRVPGYRSIADMALEDPIASTDLWSRFWLTPDPVVARVSSDGRLLFINPIRMRVKTETMKWSRQAGASR